MSRRNHQRSYACQSYDACALSRRSLLRVGGMGLLGLTMPGLLRSEDAIRSAASAAAAAPLQVAPKAKSVIFLYQFGGPSHIDMFDMKPDAPEQIRGPHKSMKSVVPEMPVNTLMPRMAKVMDKVA